MILRLGEEDVDVVTHRIDFDERRVVIPENARDVGVELAAFFITDELATAFRAEHEMNDDVGEGLRHGSGALAGLGKSLVDVELGLGSSDSLQPRLSHCRAFSPANVASFTPHPGYRRAERHCDLRPTVFTAITRY